MDGIKYLEVVLAVDGAFAANPDKSSQIGIIVNIRDKKTKTCDIVHYRSSKSKPIYRSPLTAELLAMVGGYDIGFTLRNTLRTITGRDIDLVLATDSKSGYGLVVTLAQTTERRLQIDLDILREAYEKRDLTSIV